MSENISKVYEFASLVRLSAENGTLKNAVLAAPVSGDIQKIRIEMIQIGKKVVLQAELSLTEGRVKQQNIDFASVGDFIVGNMAYFKRAELNDSGGTASLMKSKKGKETLVSKGSIGRGQAVAAKSNNREKQYILSGKEEFLRYLGISDANGRIYDKKQSKFRQINKFLENLRDVVKYLPKEGEVRVADLCCGKSYLSFAVYYYLTVCLDRKVSMFCIDIKASVMEYCADAADKCGFDGMRFEAGDVNGYKPEKKPHLVVSLHACDVATDIVLDKGMSLSADVILSTPCCHRDLSRRLDCTELEFISRHSILKSKFCDAATDALRILRLEACGYSCTAIELIDPDDTPKNVLIRAIKKKTVDYGNSASRAAAEKYKNAHLYLTGKEAPELPVILK